MGLLDGVEKFLEEKLFKKMEDQFRELISELKYMRDQLKETNSNLRELIEIQKKRAMYG
jgi:hypothetical protein